MPPNNQKPLFKCKKLTINTTKCDLCLFLHKMCCKMVWKFCESWKILWEFCFPDGSYSVRFYLSCNRKYFWFVCKSVISLLAWFFSIANKELVLRRPHPSEKVYHRYLGQSVSVLLSQPLHMVQFQLPFCRLFWACGCQVFCRLLVNDYVHFEQYKVWQWLI